MKPLPSSFDLRITDQDGRVFGLNYLDDGYAPTVPCMAPGCYRPASFLAYELREAQGMTRRYCPDHAPSQWFALVRATLEGMKALPDRP